MDFSYSPEDERFRRELRAWLAKNKPARAERVPHDDASLAAEVAFLRDWQRSLHAAGYLGLLWPREYGGRGARPTEQAILNQELARARAPQLLNRVGVNNTGPTLIAHGTEAQKRRFLPPILSADEIWCQLFSEPGAGSDLAALRTRAEPDGDGFVVSGQKVWTSYAQFSRWAILLARTDPSLPKHRGLTYFILDMESPGITIRPLRQLTGSTEFSEVFLDAVRVPRVHVVGVVNQGWEIALTTLAHERGTGFAFKEQVLQRIAVEDLVRLARARAGRPRCRQTSSRSGSWGCRGEAARLDDERHQHEPRERHERHPADRVHGRRRGAERAPHHEGPGGGQVAARVVAEARAGAAQPRREELGQVEAERARDPVDGEPVQEEEPHAHDRLPVAPERDPDRRGAARQVEREERAAAEARHRNGGQRADEPAQVEHGARVGDEARAHARRRVRPGEERRSQGQEGVRPPPGDQRHDAHGEPAEGGVAEPRGEQLRQTRGLVRLALPHLGLAHAAADPERDRRGCQAGEEDEAPGQVRLRGEERDALGEEVVDQRGEEDAEGRARVEQRTGGDAPALGHDLRHQARPRRPLAADAERRDEAEGGEHPDVGREGARGGGRRVDEHGQR